MESYGQEGKIQISQDTFDLLKGSFNFEKRASFEVKGKGIMDTYLLNVED